MKNYESLLTKIEESTEEFKKNLGYNEFEKSLTDLMNQYLAEYIQTELEAILHDKWFLSVLCSIAGKQCLSLEGYRLVSVHVLNDQRILVSTPYFYNRVQKKRGQCKGNNIDCHLGLSTMYLTDEKGNIDKSFNPVYDATMPLDLIETYLDAIDTSAISRPGVKKLTRSERSSKKPYGKERLIRWRN